MSPGDHGWLPAIETTCDKTRPFAGALPKPHRWLAFIVWGRQEWIASD